jgi:drug/metabolite transporter (DMT)-like permease
LSDLSILGPINAWKPVVSLVPGMLLLHEFPGWLGVTGIVLIVAGSYWIVDDAPAKPVQRLRLRLLGDRGVQYRFAALILSAIEAVFLKKAIEASSSVETFAIWSILGFVISATAIGNIIGMCCLATHFAKAQDVPPRQSLRHEFRILRESRYIYLMLAATSGLMQLCTVVTLEQFQVGYALALFQMSALISVFLGRHLFNEPHFIRRMAGATVMVAGAVLIILGN